MKQYTTYFQKLNVFLFLLLFSHKHFHHILQSEFQNTMNTFPIDLPVIDALVTDLPVNSDILKAAPRKRRTPEEIAAEKAEKSLRKQQREESRILAAQKAKDIAMKKNIETTPLFVGTNIYAIAAMSIIAVCKRNRPRTNLAFHQMIASRYIFPPKKNINKFATGGVAEECLSQLLCDVGFTCSNLSEESNIIDLEVQVPIEDQTVSLQVSLKNSGKISSSPILENYRGQKREEIRPLPPTFIIYTEMDIRRVRMVYLDDEILRKGYPGLSEEDFHAEIYTNRDANLTFRSGFLAKFIPRLPEEYILDADYPGDLSTLKEQNFSRLALAEVIRQLHI